jgi:hypothetical protein
MQELSATQFGNTFVTLNADVLWRRTLGDYPLCVERYIATLRRFSALASRERRPQRNDIDTFWGNLASDDSPIHRRFDILFSRRIGYLPVLEHVALGRPRVAPSLWQLLYVRSRPYQLCKPVDRMLTASDSLLRRIPRYRGNLLAPSA